MEISNKLAHNKSIVEWQSMQKKEKKTRTPMNKLAYEETCQERKKKEPYTF